MIGRRIGRMIFKACTLEVLHAVALAIARILLGELLTQRVAEDRQATVGFPELFEARRYSMASRREKGGLGSIGKRGDRLERRFRQAVVRHLAAEQTEFNFVRRARPLGMQLKARTL